jgi:hypothetical protein
LLPEIPFTRLDSPRSGGRDGWKIFRGDWELGRRTARKRNGYLSYLSLGNRNIWGTQRKNCFN